MIRRRVIVHGMVQGVGFRYSARSAAGRIGVAGYARNLPDGSVEAEVEGDEAAVERMLAWLAKGPPHARVTGLDVTEREPLGQAGFDIRY